MQSIKSQTLRRESGGGGGGKTEGRPTGGCGREMSQIVSYCENEKKEREMDGRKGVCEMSLARPTRN